jgi:parvulin-like peptidyl-prolyl isomerase
MSRGAPLLLALALLAAGLAGLGAPAGRAWAGPTMLLDQVKIAVDDKAMTLREYEQLRRMQEQEDRQQFKGQELQDKLAHLDDDLVQRITEDLLLETYATRLKIVVSDKDIEERVDNILRRQPNLQEVYSDEQLKSLVLRDLLRRRVLAREVDSRVRVTTQDVVAACRSQTLDNRELDVGHILLRSTDDASRARLLEIRKQLVAGADFDALALKYSQDPSVSSNKGHLGFISRGQFVKPFEDAAFALPVGAVSEPVVTEFGLHLIKVFGERTKGRIDCDKLDSVTEQSLENQIFAKRRDEELHAFLTRIRKQADIRVYETK